MKYYINIHKKFQVDKGRSLFTELVRGNSRKMVALFNASAIEVCVFSLGFIGYSSFFFTKKRKKVGIYSLLGLKKKQISKMLFYENAIMGVLAICIGILF